MREMLIHQPDNPLDFVAKCLKRFAKGEAEDSDPRCGERAVAAACRAPDPSPGAAPASGTGSQTIACPQATTPCGEKCGRARGGGGRPRRRNHCPAPQPVFCPAAPTDEDWAPPIHSKTDGQVEMLLRVLERHPVLGRLSRDQQFILIDAMDEQFCEGGDVLCREGDWLTHAYFVEAGALDVMGTPRPCTLGPQDAACEECLLYPCRARVTIRAAQDTNAWALDADVYRRVLRETVEKEDAAVRSRLAGTDLFGWMTDAQRQRALPACAFVDYDAGDCLWGEGGAATEDAALVVVEVCAGGGGHAPSRDPPPSSADPTSRPQGVLREEGEDGARDVAANEVAGQAVFLRVRPPPPPLPSHSLAATLRHRPPALPGCADRTLPAAQETHDVRRIVAAREGYAIRVGRAAVDRVLGDFAQLARAQP